MPKTLQRYPTDGLGPVIVPATGTGPDPSVLRATEARVRRGQGKGAGSGCFTLGRKSEGLYPKVDRTKLAAAVGVRLETVVRWFNGRTKIPLARAVKVAGLVGVTVERLGKDLGRQAKKKRQK